MVRAGCGTPIAYLDDAGRVVSCPAGGGPITARALFVIVDGRAVRSADALRAALGRRES